MGAALLWRLAVTVALGLGCAPLFGKAARAINCAPLEMRVMQLQSRISPEPAQLNEARTLLAQCNGAQPVAAVQSWGAIPRQGTPREGRKKHRAGPSNTVRTLCVRTCDGYYFPISFSTTRKYLEADDAACRRMCPVGDASLYYHSRRQGPEQMVSIDGAPYSELENAFRYRTVLDRSCTCGTPLPVEPTEVILATYSGEPPLLSVPAEDPEEVVDRLGDLLHTSSVPLALAEPTAAETVRIIVPMGNAEQDQLLATSVPGKWFQKETEVSYPRRPGELGCLSRGHPCQAQ